MKNPHEKWMKVALDLACKGRFTTSPNPMVGACVVKKNVLIGQGYHERYGEKHAEINALQSAGKKASGATLYVTLEPCASWGKTPPCVAAIVRAGIREVIVGALDPNPLNHGKGIEALKKSNIRVKINVLSNEVQRQNESFFKHIKTGRPFVTLKMAQSLDGKIATVTGKSRWISSPPSRQFVHRLRAEQDAILVGKNTLLLDNPRLSPLIKIENGFPEKPWRVVLDPRLEVSKKARIFEGDQLTLLVVSERHLGSPRLKKNNSCTLLPVREKQGRLDLKDLLKKLADLGVAKLLVEGGGELAWSFIKEGLVDKVCWIVAPKIVGGRLAKTSVEGDGIRDLEQAVLFREMNVSKLGDDWLFEGRL